MSIRIGERAYICSQSRGALAEVWDADEMQAKASHVKTSPSPRPGSDPGRRPDQRQEEEQQRARRRDEYETKRDDSKKKENKNKKRKAWNEMNGDEMEWERFFFFF